MAGTRGDVERDPLLEERASAEWAGMFDHIDQDTRDDDAATEPPRSPDPAPRCRVVVGRRPKPANLRGFDPVRCDEPLPCPEHGGES